MANEELNPTQPPAPAAAPAPVATTGGAAAAPAPEKIGIEDFTKVEMRVGQIKTAERIVGADKLLKLTVDIGTEIRQICAGIAQFYEPEKTDRPKSRRRRESCAKKTARRRIERNDCRGIGRPRRTTCARGISRRRRRNRRALEVGQSSVLSFQPSVKNRLRFGFFD